MKRKAVVFAAVLLLVIVVVSVVVTNGFLSSSASKKEPFHVGVTFGGDNVADAKQLIDEVKDYTNLFVMASGSLQNNDTALQEIGDYAVNSGLGIITYFGSFVMQRERTADFSQMAQQRWGSHFLGVYYGDEPSGKAYDQYMRDNQFMRFDNVPGLGNVSVDSYQVSISQISGSIWNGKSFYYHPLFEGQITVSYSDSANGGNHTTYFPNGTISLSRNVLKDEGQPDLSKSENLIYLPNGTVLKQAITLQYVNGEPIVYAPNGTKLPQQDWNNMPLLPFFPVTDKGNISQFESYQQLWDSRPFQNMDDLSAIAKSYVETQKQTTTNWIKTHTNTILFTADYVLHWWDYQIGYDTVFAELGWNNTVAQEIGLARGAANLQNKEWGTIITWKYTEEPYLCIGDEMFEQMKTSYEAGADYVVVFNYAPDMNGTYGTLQPEHFEALQRFWNDVVQSPWVAHGGAKAEAALVLPADYGWGMRNMNDSIWGIWKPDNTTQQIWNLLQDKLGQYGSKLDIVYDDPAYPVAGKYSRVIYWNQTG